MVTAIIVCFLAGLVSSLLIWRYRRVAATAKSSAAYSERKAEAAAQEAHAQRTRADAFFSIIQGIEAERDIWRGFYYESARQAGVAQNWLVRDLEAMIFRANAYAVELRKAGKKVPDIAIDPKLRDVLTEYGAKFPDGVTENVKTAEGFAAAEKIQAEYEAGRDPAPA